MYARIVRFTGGDADQIAQNVAEIKERSASGPPEGVPSTGIRFCTDKDNGVVVVVAFFDTEEDMRKGHEVLEGMSPPQGSMGERSSVDLTEVEISVDA